MKKTTTKTMVQTWNGESKSDFMKTVCTLEGGRALSTPAGVLYAPVEWRNGTPCITFQDLERDNIALVSLNKIFSRIRHFQALNAETTSIVRTVREFCLENLMIKENERVSCALPEIKSDRGFEWCLDVVRLIRRTITSLGLVSREKGISSAFYISVCDDAIYLHITGCRSVFSKAERDTMNLIRLEAVHE